MSTNPLKMQRMRTVLVFSLFIIFSAENNSSAEIAAETSIEIQTKVSYSRKVKVSRESETEVSYSDCCSLKSSTVFKFGSNNKVTHQNDYLDCEILLNLHLAPMGTNKNGGCVKGSIESTRKNSDPLYFVRLDVSSAANIINQGISSIQTMNLETTIILVSNTLVCIFVVLQLYHVKKNPEVLSFISLVMLVILTLGHMIPLALDFETLCSSKQDQHKVLSHSGRWFELNEVIVMVVMVVAFLLLLRLLELTVSARLHDSNRKHLQSAEEITALVILFLYAAGAKITLIVAWENYRPEFLLLSSPTEYQLHTICNDVKSYAGLLLDAFLLPQVLLNLFSSSRQNALSSSFYMGTTFVRLLPRAYDLCHKHSYVLYNILYFSVNLDKGFYSAAWDVIIFLALLLLAAIIYFQQKFGGHCILPPRFRE